MRCYKKNGVFIVHVYFGQCLKIYCEKLLMFIWVYLAGELYGTKKKEYGTSYIFHIQFKFQSRILIIDSGNLEKKKTLVTWRVILFSTSCNYYSGMLYMSNITITKTDSRLITVNQLKFSSNVNFFKPQLLFRNISWQFSGWDDVYGTIIGIDETYSSQRNV